MHRRRLVVIACGVLAACAGDDGAAMIGERVGVVSVRAGSVVSGHDADGVLVERRVAGEPGVELVDEAAVGIAAGPGGAVTVVDPTGTSWLTILDVAPGDRLYGNTGPTAAGDAPARMLAVEVMDPPAGAVRIEVNAPCASAAGVPGARIALPLRCWMEKATLIATALDGDGAPIAYMVVRDTSLATASLAIAGPWRPPTDTYAIELTGVPDGVERVAVERWALDLARFGGGSVPVHRTATIVETPGPLAGAVVAHPDVDIDAFYRIDAGGRGWLRRRYGDVDRLRVDLTRLLPAVTALELGDHELRWAGGDGGDGVVATITAGAATWTIVAPPGRHAIVLPDDVGFPWPEDHARATATVTVVESSAYDDYRALRARVRTLDPGWVPLGARFSDELEVRTSTNAALRRP